jgi:hypothetical protein
MATLSTSVSGVVVGDALLDPATGEMAGPAAVVIDDGRVTEAGIGT